MFDTVVTVWAAGWAAVAGFGAWRYAGRSGTRTVRVAARVERVGAQRESGSDITSGIQVVVAFQNPATGEQLSLPTTGPRNGTLDAAWVGRPVTVRFPAGQPYNFTLVTGLGRQRALALPVAAACLAWLGLAVRLTMGDYGIGWVPLAIGVPTALLAGWGTAATYRSGRRRSALLAAAEEATGRVVASLQSSHRDDDGHTHTDYVPVMAFTTADGRAVTAVGPAYTRRAQPHTVGTDVTVHYAPADPSVFAFDRATDRKRYGCGTAALAFCTAAGAAATVTGLVLLG